MCIYIPAVGFVLLLKNLVFLPSIRLLTTRFALATLITTVCTTGASLALHFTITVRFGIVGALLSLGGTYLFSYLVAEGLARKVCPASIPFGRLAARLPLFGAVVASATLLVSLPPNVGIHALHLAAFLVTGLPLAYLIYRRG